MWVGEAARYHSLVLTKKALLFCIIFYCILFYSVMFICLDAYCDRGLGTDSADIR